jgi:hypothetical protein
MKYHKTDTFSREEHQEEENTKVLVMINLTSFKEGISWSDLNELISEAVKGSKNYSIFNMDEGLLVEKMIDKQQNDK